MRESWQFILSVSFCSCFPFCIRSRENAGACHVLACLARLMLARGLCRVNVCCSSCVRLLLYLLSSGGVTCGGSARGELDKSGRPTQGVCRVGSGKIRQNFQTGTAGQVGILSEYNCILNQSVVKVTKGEQRKAVEG